MWISYQYITPSLLLNARAYEPGEGGQGTCVSHYQKWGEVAKLCFTSHFFGENIYKRLKFEYEGGKCAVKHEI
jgi:hypothetical protein